MCSSLPAAPLSLNLHLTPRLSDATLSGNPSWTLLFHSGLTSFYSPRASGLVTQASLMRFSAQCFGGNDPVFRTASSTPIFPKQPLKPSSGLCGNPPGSSRWEVRVSPSSLLESWAAELWSPETCSMPWQLCELHSSLPQFSYLDNGDHNEF